MESTAPRRRGRPPANAAPISQDTIASPASEKPTRRRRAAVGGFALKLDAPQRPGFVRRWFNDDGNRIAQAQELAYDHVTDPNIKSSSSDTRTSRLVGTKANGEPLRAYLMETPVEEYEAGLAEKEVQPRQIDEAIAAGRDSTGQMPPSAEVYGQGSIDRR